MTKIVGLIGYPLGHSISPVFQQAAFDKLGIDARYELWETPPENLEATVKGILDDNKLGSNVTVPYKEDVIPFLDDLNDVARDIGAVNTIVKGDRGLTGYNTDAEGFLRAVQIEGEFDPKGKKVTMIGAGGVARAIGFSMVKAGIKSLAMFDIDQPRVQKLASDLGFSNIIVLKSDEGSEYEEAVAGADLLINCTPIGMKHSSNQDQSPVSSELLAAQSLVYDVVYNPLKTPLLKIAEGAGIRTLGGLTMLVYQGVAAFELWTEQKAPVDIMMAKAEGAL